MHLQPIFQHYLSWKVREIIFFIAWKSRHLTTNSEIQQVVLKKILPFVKACRNFNLDWNRPSRTSSFLSCIYFFTLIMWNSHNPSFHNIGHLCCVGIGVSYKFDDIIKPLRDMKHLKVPVDWPYSDASMNHFSILSIMESKRNKFFHCLKKSPPNHK